MVLQGHEGEGQHGRVIDAVGEDVCPDRVAAPVGPGEQGAGQREGNQQPDLLMADSEAAPLRSAATQKREVWPSARPRNERRLASSDWKRTPRK